MDRPQGAFPFRRSPRSALRGRRPDESFTFAAEELRISRTAVSHHVRALEGELGVALFVRKTRRVELTNDGRAWADALSDVFSRLYAANRRLRPTTTRGRSVVTVSVIPSFASRWFVPRLGRFLERYPDVDVRVSWSGNLVDFAGRATLLSTLAFATAGGVTPGFASSTSTTMRGSSSVRRSFADAHAFEHLPISVASSSSPTTRKAPCRPGLTLVE